jgi:hypothetical protein
MYGKVFHTRRRVEKSSLVTDIKFTEYDYNTVHLR